MQTQVTKKIDFKGKDLYIGLDVHKKSWSVTILVEGMEHKTFTQPPDPRALYNYLQKIFPGGTYYSAFHSTVRVSSIYFYSLVKQSSIKLINSFSLGLGANSFTNFPCLSYIL